MLKAECTGTSELCWPLILWTFVLHVVQLNPRPRLQGRVPVRQQVRRRKGGGAHKIEQVTIQNAGLLYFIVSIYVIVIDVICTYTTY